MPVGEEGSLQASSEREAGSIRGNTKHKTSRSKKRRPFMQPGRLEEGREQQTKKFEQRLEVRLAKKERKSSKNEGGDREIKRKV